MNSTTHHSLNPLASSAPAGKAQTPSTSSRALASVLLAAGVAALVVTTDHLLDAWAERHVVGAWIALWAVAVLAIAVLRGLSRHVAQAVMRGLDGWSASVAQRRSDRRLWAMAQSDSRMMGELQSAFDREDKDELPTQDVDALARRRAARVLRQRLHHI
jgi:hypothetical protein